ncbi:MAG TPA: DUF2283 domain-containing protein [Chitinophagaceae bacterium]|nr:DUF2283 domain-containing protein [Chitinophagaceae bacterium]
MKVKYDKETDVLYIQLSNNPVAESDSEKSGIILDYDEQENVVGIEVLNASRKMQYPFKVEYEVA